MTASKDIIELLNKVPRINKKVYWQIKRDGVISGSYVFGGYDKDNYDIDVLIPPHKAEYYKEAIQHGFAVYSAEDYVDDDSFVSLYLKDPRGRILNLLIFYTMEEFESWEFATQSMKKLIKIPIFKRLVERKRFRVELFSLLKDNSPAEDYKSNKKMIDAYNVEGTGEDVPF